MRIEPLSDVSQRDRPAGAARAARADRPPPAAVEAGDTVELSPTTVPDQPPTEVLEQVQAAARRVDDLAAAGRALSYDVDPQTGALRVELRDASGAVLGELSPSAALDVAAGAELG